MLETCSVNGKKFYRRSKQGRRKRAECLNLVLDSYRRKYSYSFLLRMAEGHTDMKGVMTSKGGHTVSQKVC